MVAAKEAIKSNPRNLGVGGGGSRNIGYLMTEPNLVLLRVYPLYSTEWTGQALPDCACTVM